MTWTEACFSSNLACLNYLYECCAYASTLDSLHGRLGWPRLFMNISRVCFHVDASIVTAPAVITLTFHGLHMPRSYILTLTSFLS